MSAFRRILSNEPARLLSYIVPEARVVMHNFRLGLVCADRASV
jgi:hypothetical protein